MTQNFSSSVLSESEQEKLIRKLDIFKIQGQDKRGCTVLRVLGKFFPARVVRLEVLNKYLEENVYPCLGEKPFSVLYVNTGVNRSDNFPGMTALRAMYEAMPATLKNHLQTIYFLHPGFHSRLFLAVFGRLLFAGGLYGKLKYVNRLEFLWDDLRRKETEIPEYVYDHDEELDSYHPVMDYGLESDHPRVFTAPAVDSPALTHYSMRCIA